MATFQEFLLIILGETLTLRRQSAGLSNSISLLGRNFAEATKRGGSTGHYDWLRSPDLQLQGLRYWPFSDDDDDRMITEKLFIACRLLPYSVVEPAGKFLTIHFVSEPLINESASNDQDLSDNGIYASSDGALLLYFDISGLQPEELAQVHRMAPEASADEAKNKSRKGDK